MISKSTVKESLNHLPEKFTLEELLEELILAQKIENGLKDSEENKIISEEELDNEIKKWFE
jgi:hypothetical protein